MGFAAGAILAVTAYRIAITAGVHHQPEYLRYAFEARIDNILYGCCLAIVLRGRKYRAAGWIPAIFFAGIAI